MPHISSNRLDLSDFKDVSFGSSTTHAKSVVVWSSPMLNYFRSKIMKEICKLSQLQVNSSVVYTIRIMYNVNM